MDREPCDNKEIMISNSTTFLVKIMYTQHTSTQGSIQWLEQQKTISFRSFRELIFLIEQGLSSGRETMELRNWEEASCRGFGGRVGGKPMA